jgi:hypothetical protein
MLRRDIACYLQQQKVTSFYGMISFDAASGLHEVEETLRGVELFQETEAAHSHINSDS